MGLSKSRRAWEGKRWDRCSGTSRRADGRGWTEQESQCPLYQAAEAPSTLTLQSTAVGTGAAEFPPLPGLVLVATEQTTPALGCCVVPHVDGTSSGQVPYN